VNELQDEVLLECRNCGEEDCHERCANCDAILCACGTCRDARLCECFASEENAE
jgi:hypothetical protein